MKTKLLVLTSLAATLGVTSHATAQTADFQWRGTVAQENTIEIRGVNGSVRAVPSSDGAVHVEATRQARRSDPQSVRIEVVEHAGGVTLCAVYPTPEGARRANECRPGGGQINVQDNDVQVDFVVRVPAGVHFAGSTVNGGIDAEGLRSDVRASTVNGRVNIQTTGFVSRAATVNGNIVIAVPADLNARLNATTLNGTIDSDFPVQVTNRVGQRVFRGTIGAGGDEIRVSTVNGSIRLRRL